MPILVNTDETRDFIKKFSDWLNTEDGQQEARRWSKEVRDEVGLAKILMQRLVNTPSLKQNLVGAGGVVKNSPNEEVFELPDR